MTAAAKRLPLHREEPVKKWVYRDWGKLSDPVHKSNMSTLVGGFACTEQFRRDKQREIFGFDRETCSGKTEMGTAVHETLARALRTPELRNPILAGRVPTSRDTVRSVIVEEFNRATAGRTVNWYGKGEFAKELEAATSMVLGTFADLHRHVRQVELVEAGFIVTLGDLFLEGHVDLVYRPQGEAFDEIAFCDWKTGAQKPHQIELDHGYEGGFYAHALAEGLFVDGATLKKWKSDAELFMRELNEGAQAFAAEMPFDIVTTTALAAAATERDAMHIALRACMRRQLAGEAMPEGVVHFHRFPKVIRRVHLRDYVPYTKKGSKVVERPEDLILWSRVLDREIAAKTKIEYAAGQQRGGAWMVVSRREGDVARLESMLRSIVSWVRFGRFVPACGEKCTRCSYRSDCLNDGYQLPKGEQRALNADLRGLDLGDTDDLDDD